MQLSQITNSSTNFITATNDYAQITLVPLAYLATFQLLLLFISHKNAAQKTHIIQIQHTSETNKKGEMQSADKNHNKKLKYTFM